MAKEKSLEQAAAIQARWDSRKKKQKLNEMQQHLPVGFHATNVAAIQKEVHKKNSADIPKIWWTSWCVNAEGEKFLALYDGVNIKLIPEKNKNTYLIRTLK